MGGRLGTPGDLSVAPENPLSHLPALPTEPLVGCLLVVEPDHPILLGKLRPSVCRCRSGLEVPPEETQDEQGQQQCGQGHGVAHGVHDLQPLQNQPLILSRGGGRGAGGQGDTGTEFSASPRARKGPCFLFPPSFPISPWGSIYPRLSGADSAPQSRAEHVTSQPIRAFYVTPCTHRHTLTQCAGRTRPKTGQ